MRFGINSTSAGYKLQACKSKTGKYKLDDDKEDRTRPMLVRLDMDAVGNDV